MGCKVITTLDRLGRTTHNMLNLAEEAGRRDRPQTTCAGAKAVLRLGVYEFCGCHATLDEVAVGSAAHAEMRPTGDIE